MATVGSDNVVGVLPDGADVIVATGPEGNDLVTTKEPVSKAEFSLTGDTGFAGKPVTKSEVSVVLSYYYQQLITNSRY